MRSNREIQAERNLQVRAWLSERGLMPGQSPLPPHGREARYSRGCRCAECRAAAAEARRFRATTSKTNRQRPSRAKGGDWRSESLYGGRGA